MEAGDEAVGEVFAAVQETFKGNGAGAGAIVEEDGDAAAVVEFDQVGMGGVDGGVGGLGPGSCLFCCREDANAGGTGRGARTVNLMPSWAMRSSTLRLTAVSASHMPSGLRPKRNSKSAMPQRIWVRASRGLASGMMMWL